MYNYVVTRDGCVGFGDDYESAEYDLYLNLCRRDFKYDKGEFLKRRQELKPWMPRENMLHIAGVGCLVYEDFKLTNTKTGKSVPVNTYKYAICYHLMNLVGDMLSYTDIMIVLRPELDKLFSSISDQFVKLEDMPSIQLLGKVNGFNPDVLYHIGDDIVIGISDTMIGMRTVYEEFFHAVDSIDGMFMVPLLAYIGCKIGYVFNESGVYEYGTKAEDI